MRRKSVRPSHLASNCTSQDFVAHRCINGTGKDGYCKRVWKACERCRMKKAKCDGEFPCKRCKENGVICTPFIRKKKEYKQVPGGYAEILENTQVTLIAVIHKLYAMVRNSQSWELGEPVLNDLGAPVVHNIAQKLGCIRPNSDIDLPAHSVFPEEEAGMIELARQLEEQQTYGHDDTNYVREAGPAMYGCSGRASPSELGHSDFKQDYRELIFGNHDQLSHSPQSHSSGSYFGLSRTMVDADATAMFSSQSSFLHDFVPNHWVVSETQVPPMVMQAAQHPISPQRFAKLNQEMFDNEFCIAPYYLSGRAPTS